MDIRCRKTTCKFNISNKCIAKEIIVDKNVLCSTYKTDQKNFENKKDDKSKFMFKKTPKIAPFRDRKDIKILCKANCLFNCEGVCKANGITINDFNKAICMGYLER